YRRWSRREIELELELIDANRFTYALDAYATAVGVRELVDAPGHQHDAVAGENLPGACERAKAGGEVQRGPAETSLDRHRLTGLEADADPHRQRRIFARRGREAPLKRDRRPQRLPWRVEHA